MVSPLTADALGWAIVALGVVLLVCLRLWRGAQTSAQAKAEAQLATRSMQQMAQDLSELRQALVESRAETRLQAETHRAEALQAYAHHVGSLDAQLRQVIQQTGSQVDGGQRMTREVLERFGQDLHSQLTAHRSVISDVQGQLGALGEAARGMHELGKDIASLQDILRAPKLRGNLGELLLGEILRQVLPEDAFELQYRFDQDAQGLLIVDAVIRLGERLVPIDAKFPLEAFHRLLAERDATDAPPEGALERETKARKGFVDVIKKHVDSVAKKYIRPDCGTYDFAMVYIPAENVYYEAVVYGQNAGAGGLASYAAERKVMLVSPSTLYAYLLTVLYGLRGMNIGAQAEHLRRDLAALHKLFGTFFSSLEKSEKHLRLAQQQHEDTMKRARRLNEQMGRVTGEALALSHTHQAPDHRANAATSFCAADKEPSH